MPSWLSSFRNALEACQLLSLHISKLGSVTEEDFSDYLIALPLRTWPTAPTLGPRNPYSAFALASSARQLSIPILTAQSRMRNNHGVL